MRVSKNNFADACCTQPTVPPKSTLISYDINTPVASFVDMAKTNVNGAPGTLNSGRVFLLLTDLPSIFI